ncbi:KorB domain-containing protein, partial [Francisella tularensis]|uniref:KorB domain-containing protein n=1 Tax=Francisella tularensis TaxID=263 RepID=UPI002381AABC
VKKSDIATLGGRDTRWISLRLTIADANADIRELSNRGIIDDVRTLYDLKKFAEEIPQGAQELVKNALENKMSGSYRS